MCVGNPTVNSYCRMWDFGFWAPVYKNWGWQNRTCTVRVASGGRFEYRGVDSSCNPYLTDRRAADAPASTGSAASSTPARPSRATPTTCSQRAPSSSACPTASARRSRRSRPTRSSASAMPGRLYDVFMHYKRDEWERYLAAVTDWERDAVPGGHALTEAGAAMCGIAGIIYRNGGGEREVGRDMTRMLQAMKHRGPDSTGFALYRGDADELCHAREAQRGGRRRIAELAAARAAPARPGRGADARRRRRDRGGQGHPRGR